MNETDETSHRDAVFDVVHRYCETVERGLRERCEKLEVDLYDTAPHEVAGALIARQATLSIQLARSPGNWNGHVAPLFLRAMVDAHISLAWVLSGPPSRAKQFILYGLGQEKLFIEHLKSELDERNGEDEQLASLIEAREGWLNAQRRDFMTEVNVGSWSGHNTREMAEQSGCESLYKYAYLPFSGAAHSMWQHVGVYNLQPCTNPLHKYHRMPAILPTAIDPDYVYRSSKYVTRSFNEFDKVFSLQCETELPRDFFVREMGEVYRVEVRESDEPSGLDAA